MINCGRPGPFGNPFVVGIDGDRETVVKKHIVWIRSPYKRQFRNQIRFELKDHLDELWCPGCRGTVPCHIEIIKVIALEPLEI